MLDDQVDAIGFLVAFVELEAMRVLQERLDLYLPNYPLHQLLADLL